MSELIQIKDFGTVFTNADKEDIPENALTELQNLLPTNGKVVKTFGFGSKVGTALSYAINNLVTYFNKNLSAGTGSGSGTGYVYIAIVVNSAADTPISGKTINEVTLYYWTGSAWYDCKSGANGLFKNTTPTIYHKVDKNPIVQKSEILRILPGNVGEADGTNESKGLWVGYINRDYFDQIYVADTDYNSGFWTYVTELSAPSFSVTTSLISGGSYGNTDVRYYKLSYVYDGLNESLLSNQVRVAFTATSLLNATFTITQASHNKRITGINVYRSDTGEDNETAGQSGGSFYKIHEIDLLRKTTAFIGDASDGCYNMRRRFYVNDTGTVSASGYSGSWGIEINGGTIYQLDDATATPDSDIPVVFILHSTESDLGNVSDGAWELRRYQLPSLGGLFDVVASGGDGCYFGANKVVVYDSVTSFPHDFGSDQYNGSLLFTNDGEIDVISGSFEATITLSDDYTANFGDKAWQILIQARGLYYFEEDGSDVNGYFFDNDITAGSAFPLLNSPSIKVNGKYELIHLGKKWMYNVVLDPGDKNEAQPTWLADSEIDQYDVCPVSNVNPDISHNEGTGMSVSFGSILLFTQASVHKLIISDVTDRNTWQLVDSPFSRGHIGDTNVLTVGDNTFFWSWDGIYKITANTVAASDSTPLIKARISEPINDTYLALSTAQKQAIIATYDPENLEAIFNLNGEYWAYSMLTDAWREIDSAVTVTLAATDEEDFPLIFDTSDKKLYTTSANESVGCKLRTKWFSIVRGIDRNAVLRYLKVRYLSAVVLTVNVYIDDDDSTIIATDTLPIAASVTPIKIAIRERAKSVMVEIIDETTTTNNTEIYEIQALIG